MLSVVLIQMLEAEAATVQDRPEFIFSKPLLLCSSLVDFVVEGPKWVLHNHVDFVNVRTKRVFASAIEIVYGKNLRV